MDSSGATGSSPNRPVHTGRSRSKTRTNSRTGREGSLKGYRVSTSRQSSTDSVQSSDSEYSTDSSIYKRSISSGSISSEGYFTGSRQSSDISDDEFDWDDSDEALLPQPYTIRQSEGEIPDTAQAQFIELEESVNDEDDLDTSVHDDGDDGGAEIIDIKAGELTVSLWQTPDGEQWVERSRAIPLGNKNIPLIIQSDADEYKLLSILEHPNIVTVQGFEVRDYQDETEVVLIMEFAGNTMSNVAKGIPEPEQMHVLANWGAQIADTLGYFQTREVLHRDLKPANLLIRPDSQDICLIDFGEAVDCGEGFPSDSAGSAKYAAPETLAGQEQSYASDMYGAGRSMIDALMDCGIIDQSWTRTYSHGKDIKLELKAAFAEDEKAKRLVSTVEAMVRFDPEKRITPDAAREAFKAIS
ncbi:protein kinase domain-containing protein [Parendozoicomonas haliclonae]|uniref:Serine/threonine-protein kinase PknF n=1 Tax=Parendozoicomonas haliclonae TaxID=1960125 RepID=A0A1X7ANN0_9GAMM|nr:protein kinase [Parendozoicomonas haliclonae]SMA48595.1 Serine/threonine-protein kinase PknF [Parendozoicomonas haliclonae]